jgi:hypothetical protein
MELPRIEWGLLSLLWTSLATVNSAVIPPFQSRVPLQETCPNYASYSRIRHSDNLSAGRHQLPFQRPSKECRTYHSEEVEDAIERMGSKIQDPDLFRLFENAFPNTLDTAIKWKGFAWANETSGHATDEDLAFVITGDMYEEPRIIDFQLLTSAQRCNVAS